MSFVKAQMYSDNINVGDRVVTTKKVEACSGYFEKGTEVTITGIGRRGYDVVDDEGNRLIECSINSFKKVKQ